MASERKVTILRSENSLIEQEFDSIREKFEHEMGKMEEEMSRFRSQIIASERDRLISSLSSTMSTSSTSTSRSTSTKTCQQQQQQQILEEASEMAQQAISKQKQKQQQQHQATKLTASQTTKSSSNQSATSSASSTSKQQPQTKKPIQSVAQSNQPENSTSERFVMDGSSINWLNEMNSPLIKESEDGKILRLRFDVSTYEPEQILVRTVDNRLQIHARSEEKSDSMSRYREYNREFLLPGGTNPELIRSSLSADGILTVEAPLPAPLLNQC